MAINIHLPENTILKPCITVIGVGGAGGNAVNNMIASNLEGAKFVVANTDAQALEHSLAERRIQLGEQLTRGLGAGASPDMGGAAAEEAMDIILEHLADSNMVFITAGMGGGTGTGAAPVIAKAAKEQGILTVGVVTKPFHFEGQHRMRIADYGLGELEKYVDTLIVIPNQNLFRIANEKTTFADAFKMADDVLHAGVRGITDLMIMPGLINLDFADIRTVMSEMGKAMMGTGEAEGEGRAIIAAEAAIANPLLDNCSMKGARGVLINITGGLDMTLFEVDEAANRIRNEVDPDANIIFGSTFNPALEGKIRVSVVATGINLGMESKPKYQETINKLAASQAQNKIDEAEELSVEEQQASEPEEFAVEDFKSALNEDVLGQLNLIPNQEKFVAQSNVQEQSFYAYDQSQQPTEDEFGRSMRAAKPSNQTAKAKSPFSFFAKKPKQTVAETRKPSNKAVANNDEDLFEIPAFLRRKKVDQDHY